MTVQTQYIQLKTHSNYHMVEITSEIAKKIKESDINDGVVTLFVHGSTGALTTVEYEPGLVDDIEELFERIIPQNKVYHHNERWHDGNGHSHVRASLLGPSLSIPFVDKEMTLGTWQQIVFIDFDLPARNREIVAQIMGE